MECQFEVGANHPQFVKNPRTRAFEMGDVENLPGAAHGCVSFSSSLIFCIDTPYAVPYISLQADAKP
jgi:hypothetical protein